MLPTSLDGFCGCLGMYLYQQRLVYVVRGVRPLSNIKTTGMKLSMLL